MLVNAPGAGCAGGAPGGTEAAGIVCVTFIVAAGASNGGALNICVNSPRPLDGVATAGGAIGAASPIGPAGGA